MQKSLIILLFVISFNAAAQTTVDSLVDKGITLHDQGLYDQAIELYQQALSIDPNSALAHYEISLSYMYGQDYEKALFHSSKVIEMDEDYLLPAYITKGSCLDYLGKTDESIQLLEEGIEKFGDDYLLHYNLGVNYYKQNNFEKARDAFTKAISSKPDHTSSHLLLGDLMYNNNFKVQSLLSLHYFLLLEPKSQRSTIAYNLLQKQMVEGVKEDKKKKKHINLFITHNDEDSEFGAVNTMMSLLAASRYTKENKKKSEEELFFDYTESLFNMLGELKKEENEGLWWDFYIPFFYELSQSNHLNTYCYFISQAGNNKAQKWLLNNSEKTDAFLQWLEEYNNN